MSLDDLYREVILDHHRHPRGAHPIENPNATSTGLNPLCGDEATVNIRIEAGCIAEIQVAGHGCAISTAAGSMLAEVAAGMTTDALKALAESLRHMVKTGEVPEGFDKGDLEALKGVSRFPQRVKCAMLPVATALQALDTFDRQTDDHTAMTETAGL